MLAALGLLLSTFAYSRFHPRRTQEAVAPELVAIPSTHPHSSPVPVPPPQPDPDMMINLETIHITAISLGNPSIALINGQQMAEGDELVLPPSKSGQEINLRVAKIADGRVEFTNGGGQVINVFLETVIVVPKKP
jgi:hypothetical protein